MSQLIELEKYVPSDLIPRVGDIDIRYSTYLNIQKEYMFRTLDLSSTESIIRSVLFNYLSLGPKNCLSNGCTHIFILDEYIILQYLDLLNDDLLREMFANFFFQMSRVQSDTKFEIMAIWCFYDEAGEIFSSNVSMVVNISNVPQFQNLPYDYVGEFKNGLAVVSMNGLKGYISESDLALKIPCKFNDTINFSENLAAIKRNGLYGFCDQFGQVVITPQYEKVGDFHGGFARVYQNGKVAFIKKNGILLTGFCFEDAGDFNRGLAPIKQAGQWNYIDIFAVKEFDYSFDEADNFINDLARVKLNGLYGFINLRGELVIPCIYTSCLLFQENLVAVESNGQWGFLNKKGELAIDFQFDYIGHGFSKNQCSVELNGRMGFINRRGEKISPFVFNTISPTGRCKDQFREDLVFASLNDDWGYVDPRTRKVRERKSLSSDSCLSDSSNCEFGQKDSEKLHSIHQVDLVLYSYSKKSY
ncbi:WG repeat-containing protein [Aquirufa nivalisilvae]|uniref:WG repeat-containing protein n=1 Tax=Aquirufa nivalisilvae TaxID=2516557 RepID=UPI0022A9E9D3|nr:WG repeat-containing protein [Aquirufa nivalisilvae]MCZ2479331.1 WG repeat-containing protein [Aquirufa nivalisilvae]